MKKSTKAIFAILLVISIIRVVSYFISYGSDVSSGYDYTNDTADTYIADQSISSVVYSQEYTSAGEQEQRNMVGQTLDTLYSEGKLSTPAQYHADSDMYTFEYAGGVLGGFSFREPNSAYNTNGGDPLVERRSTVTGEDAVAIIFNGFEEDHRIQYYDKLAQDWTKRGVPAYADHNVTVEDLRNIESCSVIIFSMHGSVYGDVPTLCVNEAPNSVRDDYYYKELCIDKSVAKVTYESGNCFYEVLPRFFNQYYADSHFDGAVIFSESCEFFGGHSSTHQKVNYFSDAFASLSAEAVLGFYNMVGSSYSRNMMEMTMESIIFDGKTPKKAVAAAQKKYGSNDGMEYPSEGKYPGFLHVEGDGKNSVLFEKIEAAPTPTPAASPTPTKQPTHSPQPAAPQFANEYAAYKALLDGHTWAKYTASNAEGMDYKQYAKECLGYWLIWDIDKNGTKELIISSGWSQANFCITAFTYSGGKLYNLGSQYCGSGFAFGEPKQTGLVIKSYHGSEATHYRFDIVNGKIRITQQMEYDQYDMDHVHHLTAEGNWQELETHSLDDTSDLG